MFLIALILAVISIIAPLIVEFLSHLFRAVGSLDLPTSRNMATNVVGIVDADVELSIPTWFSATVLLLNSVLLSSITSMKKRVGERFVAHWGWLSVVFLMLSLDETAGVHDRVNLLLTPIVETGGIFTFFWTVPWSVFVVLFLAAYIRFFFSLPLRIRWLFLCAGTLYVGGALGAEMALGLMLSEGFLVGGDQDTLLWRLEVATEEFLEMSGAILFFHTLTQYCEDTSTSTGDAYLAPYD